MKNNKLNFDKLNDNTGIFLGRNINAGPIVIEPFTKKLNKYVNTLCIGTLGKATKTMIFKEIEFQKELAPQNADIKYEECNGKKIVIMTY